MRTRLAAAVLCTCNGLDAGLTLAVTRLGYATEANPFMAAMLALHPFAFVAIKFILVMGGLVVLLNHQRHMAARIVLNVLSLWYLILVLYSVSLLP